MRCSPIWTGPRADRVEGFHGASRDAVGDFVRVSTRPVRSRDHPAMIWILQLLLNAVVVLLVARMVPGVRVNGFGAAVMTAGVYALLSLLLKWLLVALTLPFIVVTFGLFLFVLNAFLLWLTDKILDSFEITSTPALFLATFGITVGNYAVDQLLH